MEHKTEKRYVVYEATIRELLHEINSKSSLESAEEVSLFTYKPEHKDMSEAQLEKQKHNTWTARQVIDMSLHTRELENMVEKKAYELMLEKNRDDVFEESARDALMETKIHACITLSNRTNGKMRVEKIVKGNIDGTEKDFFGNEVSMEYSHDVEELKSLLATAKLDYTYMNSSPDDYVYLDELAVVAHGYRIRMMHDDLKAILKRVINKNLTYCLKGGKNIVPDEYLDKGQVGIEEWRTLKRSQNKNNSMEKQMLREELKSRKDYMVASIETATREIANTNQSWAIPALDIEGRWNAGKVKKLSTQLFNGKTDAQIMEMSNEEILNTAKEYWKKILMDAYNNVCKIKDTDK